MKFRAWRACNAAVFLKFKEFVLFASRSWSHIGVPTAETRTRRKKSWSAHAGKDSNCVKDGSIFSINVEGISPSGSFIIGFLSNHKRTPDGFVNTSSGRTEMLLSDRDIRLLEAFSNPNGNDVSWLNSIAINISLGHISPMSSGIVVIFVFINSIAWICCGKSDERSPNGISIKFTSSASKFAIFCS